MIQRKTAEQIRKMRRAGTVVGDTLRMVRGMCHEGVALKELDRAAESFIRARGARPTFKGYHGFPASLCLSLNHEVVHGIPNQRKLKKGDILAIDCGATLDDFVGDAAISVGVGPLTADVEQLVATTLECLLAGIAASRIGHRLGDVGHAIEIIARRRGYGVVREYCGHGVGRELHEDPQVPNYGEPGSGPRIQSGWCLALEPMINLGGDAVHTLSDGWTVVTDDGKPSAHWEHSIAVTDAGAEILTLCSDGTQP
ncbi:MAG: type I methionyl aminopeptidase [Myxococcales bacterium]|nr:type I methionyl aminopeptidase [Myxococcales bacterium]